MQDTPKPCKAIPKSLPSDPEERGALVSQGQVTQIYKRRFVTLGERVYDLDTGHLWKVNALEVKPNAFLCVGDPEVTRAAISHVTNLQELTLGLCELSGYPDHNAFPSLEKAIQEFTKFQQASNPEWNFYTDLLPSILSWACEEVPLISPQVEGTTTSASFTPQQARSLVANSFLLNVRDLAFMYGARGQWIGSLDFGDLYKTDQKIAVHRILCQIFYFKESQSFDPEEARTIIFSRHTLPDLESKWIDDTVLVTSSTVSLHVRGMENSEAPFFVDFANKDLHIGCIIPSMTQEEILFSACPECFIGLIFSERLRDDEVMSISNVRRFSKYTGYGASFRWKGKFSGDNEVRSVLVFDAVMENQWKKECIFRDLGKCFGGFSCAKKGELISTGHWGCGAFGGDKSLKFLQQVVSASLLGVRLDYSTFGDPVCMKKLQDLLDAISEIGLSVKQVVELMLEYNTGGRYDDYDPTGGFNDFVMERLKSERH
jgi:poly(ADP-ribose) glycohydrolase